MPQTEAQAKIAELRRRNRRQGIAEYESEDLLDIAEAAIALVNICPHCNGPACPQCAPLRAAISKLVGGRT